MVTYSFHLKLLKRPLHRLHTGVLTEQGIYLPGTRIELRPHADKLVQVMRAKDGLVTSEIFKVIHDDGYKQVQHLTEEQIKVLGRCHIYKMRACSAG